MYGIARYSAWTNHLIVMFSQDLDIVFLRKQHKQNVSLHSRHLDARRHTSHYSAILCLLRTFGPLVCIGLFMSEILYDHFNNSLVIFPTYQFESYSFKLRYSSITTAGQSKKSSHRFKNSRNSSSPTHLEGASPLRPLQHSRNRPRLVRRASSRNAVYSRGPQRARPMPLSCAGCC